MPDAIDQFLLGPASDSSQNQTASPEPILPLSHAAVEDITNGSSQDFQSMVNRESASKLKPFNSFFGVNAGQNAPPQGVDITPNVDFSKRNERVDLRGNRIPLDITQGGGMAEGGYAKVASQGSPEAKLAVLKDMYPDKPSRMLDSGEIAIQINDPKTGSPKDVLINPRGMDAHDLIDLAIQTPELAAATATAIATEGAGFVPRLTQIVASSIAGAVTKQASEEIAHFGTSADTPQQSISDLRSNSEGAIINGLFQTSGLVAAKALRGLSPFAKDINPDSLEFNMNKARDVLKNEFGLDYQATPAEITGSPALKAVETMESQQPGARTIMGRINDARQATVRAVQNIALRGTVPEEQLGEQAIQSLQNKVVEPIEDAFAKAKTTAQAKGQQEVVKLLDQAAGMTSPARVTESMAGTVTQSEFDAKLASAKSDVQAAYAKVKALPGGSGDILSGDAAADAASSIRSELPTVLKDVEKPTGLLDASGNPVTRTVTERKTLQSGAPDGLLKALSDLESLKGARVSLQTLNTMKNAAYDEIAKTEAVPGVKDRWFKQIAAAYSEGIESGVVATGDPALKAALTDAKETYKTKLLPFDRPGIREMARSEFDTGGLSPKAVVTRLLSGDNAIFNYQKLKEVLGANNPAFKSIKRAWLDTQLEKVTDGATGTIDAKGLSDVIKQFRVNYPELADEFFGSNYKALESQLKTQSGIQGIEKLDATEAKTLLSLRNPSTADLAALLQMQKNRATSYFNTTLSKIADGLPIAPDIKPMEFIKHLYNTDTPSKDVKMILDHLAKEAPNVRQGIATGALYRLLDEASVMGPESAARSVSGGALDITSKGLADAIGRAGSPQQLRYMQLLGDSVVPGTASGKLTNKEFVDTLIDLIAPRDAKSAKSFGSAGGLAQGAAISQVTRNPFTYALNYAKKAVLAAIYTSKPTLAIASNRLVTPATSAAIANALIAAEPTAKALVETFGPDKAKEIMGNAKASIDRFVRNVASHPALTPATKNRDAIDMFLRGDTNAPVKIQTK